jgi:hypothetical protein
MLWFNTKAFRATLSTAAGCSLGFPVDGRLATWLPTNGGLLSRDSRQGWPGVFPASFLLLLFYLLVYVSSYSLDPYPRIHCYSRLRSLNQEEIIGSSKPGPRWNGQLPFESTSNDYGLLASIAASRFGRSRLGTGLASDLVD